VIDAIAWPGPRYLLQSLWMVAVLVMLAVVLDLTVGHMISRRDLWPWGRAVGRLWLITPFVARLYRLPLGHEAHTAGAEVTPRRPKSAFLDVNRGLGTFGLPVRLGGPARDHCADVTCGGVIDAVAVSSTW
jgi:hypothetical protein